MPYKLKKPCKNNSCINLVEGGGFCPECNHLKKDIYDENRPTAHNRGYNARWRRFRLRYIKKEPICEHCEESPADMVDHIIPISEGGAVYDEDNLQSLCNPCHAKKTAIDKKKRGSKVSWKGK